VKYWLHPDAAQEHKQQVAYYVLEPDIRRTMFKVFHFDIVYREVGGIVQVLAIAHHRRQPGYWLARI
jgi:hypothetical protein